MYMNQFFFLLSIPYKLLSQFDGNVITLLFGGKSCCNSNISVTDNYVLLIANTGDLTGKRSWEYMKVESCVIQCVIQPKLKTPHFLFSSCYIACVVPGQCASLCSTAEAYFHKLNRSLCANCCGPVHVVMSFSCSHLPF